MACEEEFCSDYVVLKAEEATPFDLIRILFSFELDRAGCVERPEAKRWRAIQHRWLVFVSILLQKLLICFKRPLAWIGCVLEMWLNLLSTNGGLARLFFNLLLGKVVMPNRSSATFTSVVGCVDVRVELDKSIPNGNIGYPASLSMMAAKLSYENEAFVQTIVTRHWMMEMVGYFNFWNDYQELYSTQAIMLHDASGGDEGGVVVVAFRGTRPFDANAWCTDVDFSWYELEGVGRIHSGFMKALGLQRGKGWPKELIEDRDQAASNPPEVPQFAYYTIRQKLRDILEKHERAKLVLTGHSLGGALAILFVAILVLHEEAWLLERLDGVYTFGQPRVGDRQFGEFMTSKLSLHDVGYYRFVYANDMVPRLPYDDNALMYRHFGTCLDFNSCYKGKVVKEEPNKNYFSLLWALPKVLNALWELIRSFVIPYIDGPDYTEGWLLKLFRLIGLAVPGLSAHFPQDYVNLTRLGCLSSLLRHSRPTNQPHPKHL